MYEIRVSHGMFSGRSARCTDVSEEPVSSIFYPEGRGIKFRLTLKFIYQITRCQISEDCKSGRNILVLSQNLCGGSKFPVSKDIVASLSNP